MSIAIQKLYKDEREVGKTIKGTKKYYVWEFVLNNKFHKIEMFHSKVTGKKKLCLDAQQLVEDQGYQSSFTYSFKVDKHYFSMVQESMDLFTLRIDNRLFDNLILDERAGRLKPDASSQQQPVQKKKETKPNVKPIDEPIPEYLRSVDSYKRNDDNFYDSDGNDFDFSGGKSNSNNFSFKQPEAKMAEVKRPQEQLLDFNDIADIKKAQQGKENPPTMNPAAFQHNQNIFNSINIFGKEEKKQSDNGTNFLLENILDGNKPNSNQSNFNDFTLNNSSNNNNQFAFNNSNLNSNLSQNPNYSNSQYGANRNQHDNNMPLYNTNPKMNEPFINSSSNYQPQINFSPNNISNQYNPNPQPSTNLNMNVNMNMGFGEIQSTQANRNSNLNTTSLNQSSPIQPYTMMNDYKNPPFSLNQPQYQTSPLDFNSNLQNKEPSFNIIPSNNPQAMLNQQQYQPFQNAQEMPSQPLEPKNDFKSKVLSSGLVDIDNLFSNKNNPNQQNLNYNFNIQNTNQYKNNQYDGLQMKASNLNSNYQTGQNTPFDF